MNKSKNPVEQLDQQLSQVEHQVVKAEELLEKAKGEVGKLAKNSSADLFSVLEEQLKQSSDHNEELSQTLKSLRAQLAEYQKDAAHWRGQFLLSQIDMVSEIDRAEQAERKLSEAVLPLPFDQRQLVKERDLSWMAFTDPITHLGNANKLDLELQEAIQSSLIEGRIVVLFMIDVDRFRAINEFAGWNQGNAVLEKLAARLVENTPEKTTIVRRGEDEFGLVVTLDGPNQGELSQSPLVRARQIADFLVKLFSEPLDLNNQRFPISASIGISACPDDADTPLEMLENAYSAVTSAKEQGGNRYIIYSDRVYAEKEHRAGLASELKQAIEAGSIQFQFRPVVDVQRGNLAAAVVEPYWDHPAHGRVLQEQFMPVAEEYGLMPILLKSIIEAGCELSRKMKGSISTIIKCPSSALHVHGFGKSFMDAATTARIKPNSLTLELPGQALVDHQSALTKLFSELGRWGVGRSISLDDKTPLPLAALQTSAISVLSLAPEMMHGVPAQEARRAVVQCYLDASKRLALPLFVNGVIDQSQAHFLAIHQCAWAAGDFLSPSLSLNDFVNRRRTTWTMK